MQRDIIQTVAQHRWHALAAAAIVVVVHGWFLNGLPPTDRLLSGSVSLPIGQAGAPIIPTTSLGCSPLYQYASPQGDAVVTAYDGTGNYEWDAADAETMHVSDDTAVLRYQQTKASTHVVTVRSQNEEAQCLVITSE